MKRRTFLVGTGSSAIGASALFGSGAFSRVESHRDVSIEVAEDPDAYLGLDGTGSSNSDNYVELDEYGHLSIDISDNPNGGEGVNSDSYTWFDSMVQVCNQGKETVGFWIVPPGDEDFPDGVTATDPDGNERLQFYTGAASGSQGDDGTESVMGSDNAVEIDVGDCIELGVRTATKSIDATDDDPLFGDEITLVADVDVEGVPPEIPPEEEFIELPVNADPEKEIEEQFDILTDTEFGTNAIEICVEKESVEGVTEIGVQVTDHHGTFQETPTTWNPGSSFLAPVTIEFENGRGCFTIGNPGVDGATLTLFPFDGGLETVDDIENIAVAVEGEEPDLMEVRGVDLESVDFESGTAGKPTLSSKDGSGGFDEHEGDR